MDQPEPAPHPIGTGPRPDALRAIEARRTARRFDPDRPVADADLRTLLRLAGLSPSPMNWQPWRFVIVRGLPNRRKLRRVAFGDPRLTDAPVALIVLADLDPGRFGLASILDQALERGALTPEAAARLRAEGPRTWGRTADLSARSAMLGAATLMIGAEALGLATAWIVDLDPEALRSRFGIPDDHAIAGIIALGHALEIPPDPGRLPLDLTTFAEHFGQHWPGAGG